MFIASVQHSMSTFSAERTIVPPYYNLTLSSFLLYSSKNSGPVVIYNPTQLFFFWRGDVSLVGNDFRKSCFTSCSFVSNWFQKEEKQLESGLEDLIQRAQALRTSLLTFIAKLECEHATLQWSVQLTQLL